MKEAYLIYENDLIRINSEDNILNTLRQNNLILDRLDVRANINEPIKISMEGYLDATRSVIPKKILKEIIEFIEKKLRPFKVAEAL